MRLDFYNNGSAERDDPAVIPAIAWVQRIVCRRSPHDPGRWDPAWCTKVIVSDLHRPRDWRFMDLTSMVINMRRQFEPELPVRLENILLEVY